MKHVFINSIPNLSTGNVMFRDIEEALNEGHTCWAFWGRGRKGNNEFEINFGWKINKYLDMGLTLIDGKAGFHSRFQTKRLLKELNKINPDVVHLNINHGYYINNKLLFDWFKKNKCKIYWTLHDCWAFTGQCAYFSYVKCEQWKEGCCKNKQCPQKWTYPYTFNFISCKNNYLLKKKTFSSLKADKMVIITPSIWLADLVKQSFLGKYKVIVKNNTIDKEVFTHSDTNCLNDYGINNKFVILGVASPWSERKGLDDFVKLAGDLDDRFKIIVVGLTKKQIRMLPNNIIGVKKTKSKYELAKLYSSANLLFNPTKEDNFPTVNLEAEACETPVITYDTGGCAETIKLPQSKVVSNYNEALELIINMNNNNV